MADAADLKSADGNIVPVRSRSPAPKNRRPQRGGCGFFDAVIHREKRLPATDALARPSARRASIPVTNGQHCSRRWDRTVFAPRPGTGQCSVIVQSRVAACGSGCRGHGAEPRAGFWVLLGGPKVPPRRVPEARLRRKNGTRIASNERGTIPPSFAFGKIHLPLHKGGFGTTGSIVILRSASDVRISREACLEIPRLRSG